MKKIVLLLALLTSLGSASLKSIPLPTAAQLYAVFLGTGAFRSYSEYQNIIKEVDSLEDFKSVASEDKYRLYKEAAQEAGFDPEKIRLKWSGTEKFKDKSMFSSFNNTVTITPLMAACSHHFGFDQKK